MRRIPFALAVLTIVSLVMGLAGCAPSQAQVPQTIKIGLITQLTGDMAPVGQTIRNGVEMAINEINAAGGVEVSLKKYKLELIVADSEGQEAKAIAGAQKLITQDGVLAIIQTERSQTAIPVSSIAENGKTVLIGGIAAPEFTVDPMTRLPKRYVFRSTFSSDIQGMGMAQFALTQLGAKTAAVLYDSEQAYSRTLAEGFKLNFVEGVGDVILIQDVNGAPYAPANAGVFSGAVVAFESYKTGDTDFTAQLNRIKAVNPDVIYLPNYLVDTPAQIKQARELGITAQFLGPDTLAHDAVLEDCGSACEGIYITTDFRPEIPNKLAEKFIADYTAAYGAEPESPAALAYDAVYILALAFERGTRVEREALRDGMTRVSGFVGVGGPIEYNQGTGDPIKSANIIQIQNGEFVWVADVQP